MQTNLSKKSPENQSDRNSSKKVRNRKSSNSLSDFLNSKLIVNKKSEREQKKKKKKVVKEMAGENPQIGFYTPGMGPLARAEQPADSNQKSGVKDSSAYSKQNNDASRIDINQVVASKKTLFKEKSHNSWSDKQSILNKSQTGDEAEKVEESLRDFIGKIISYYEKFNVGNSVLGKYEKKISQAETLLEVFDLMKEMFEELMQNVLTESKGFLDCSGVSDLKEQGMDKLIHQYEKEIRVMAVREKELVKLAGFFEKRVSLRDKEISLVKEKYDEVNNLYQ